MEKYTRILTILAFTVIGFIAGLTWGQYRLEKIQKEYTEAALQAEQAARAKEQAWQAARDTLARKYKEDTKNAEAEITALRKRIRAGAHRLSVPAHGCTVSGLSLIHIYVRRFKCDFCRGLDGNAIAIELDHLIGDAI